MAEGDANNGSVVFKTNEQPQSEAKTEVAEYANLPELNERIYQSLERTAGEEAQYAEVQNKNGVYKTPDRTDKTAERCRRYQLLAGCFGILCVILVMSIIGLWVYLSAVREKAENQLRSSQQVLLEKNQNLTDHNNKLSAENYNLTFLNEKLMEDKKNLTGQIKNMEKTWNELNVSRAQWSVDSYCPKNNGRNCSTCQDGWMNQFSSCYAYNDVAPANWETWQGAQDDCGTKSSDLTVVSDQAEKDYVINSVSPVRSDIQGYWIGLRAEGGKWKWLDGSELTDQAWMHHQPAADGQCVTSLQGRGWRSVSCNDSNAWICEKKALIF